MNNLLRFYFFNYEILKWKANSRNRYGDYLGKLSIHLLGTKFQKSWGSKKWVQDLKSTYLDYYALNLSDLTLLELVLYYTMPVAT